MASRSCRRPDHRRILRNCNPLPANKAWSSRTQGLRRQRKVKILARFDFVVASVHGRFRLGRKEQTERILRAVSNPYTTILGHMTGRQLLRRPGYDVDIEKILAACAKHGVAVEINANPWRLDLDWRWHGRALELGCMMSINPDAHSTDELDLTHWGVEMARKGGAPKERVLNCLDAESFGRHLEIRNVGRRP